MSSELTTVVAVVRQIDGNEALVEVAEEGCGRDPASGENGAAGAYEARDDRANECDRHRSSLARWLLLACAA